MKDNFLFILSFFKKKKLIFLLFLSFIFAFLESIGIGLVFPLMISILDNSFLNDFTFVIKTKEYLNIENNINFYLFLIILVFMLKFLISLIYSYFQSKEIYNFEYNISDLILKNFLRKNYNKINNFNSSEIINYIITQSSLITEYVVKNIFGLINDLILIIGIITVLFIVNYQISTVSIIFIFLIILIINIFIKKELKKLSNLKFSADQKKLKILQEIFLLLKNIKLLSLEEKFIKKFEIQNLDYKMRLTKSYFISNVPKYFIEICAVLCIVSILIYFNSVTSSQINSILPTLAILGASSARLIPALSRLQFYFSQIRFGSSNISKLRQSILHNSEHLELNTNVKEKIIFVKFDTFEIKNLSYKYLNQNNLLFDKVNFKIKKGDVVGIAGSSGSGKTTLVDIICGLNVISSGNILINDMPLNNYNLSSWTNKIGYVQQNTYLIDDTIKNNLYLFSNKNNLDIGQNQNQNLPKFLDFIDNLPEKVNTIVGENGKYLSGGQAQRIAIGRALLSRPEILILDESTNSLDEDIEMEIINEIIKLRSDILLIFISHNKKIIDRCSTIIKFENNSIQILNK
jgi:ABC-type multidrug transport system fused ATPase/permease subunit